MSTTMRMATVATFLAATSLGLVFAADLPKEGSYDYTTCFTRNSTRIDYSTTHFAYSHEDVGTSISSPPGGLFDNEAVRCVGMTASFDGKRSGGSVCEGVTKNGDKRLTRFWYDNDGKYRERGGKWHRTVRRHGHDRLGQGRGANPADRARHDSSTAIKGPAPTS